MWCGVGFFGGAAAGFGVGAAAAAGLCFFAVATDEDAVFLGMRGTPTIRIDDLDIDLEWTGPLGRAPRDYGDGPVPPKALIRRAVERARGWGHGRRAE